VRSTVLPARGLFVGEQLSEAARARLTELGIDASLKEPQRTVQLAGQHAAD